MTISRKAVLAALAGAALLAGCATGPYYDNYGHGYDGYGYGYGAPGYYAPGPGYYAPGYVAPSVELGFTYSDPGYRREWHGDNRDREWRRDGRQDHDGRDHRDGYRDGSGNFSDPNRPYGDRDPNSASPG